MVNPNYFTQKILQVGFIITVDKYKTNYADSDLTVKLNYSESEIRYVKKIMKEKAIIYVRLLNQYKLKYQTVFSARFDKKDEYGLILDEIEFYIKLNSN